MSNTEWLFLQVIGDALAIWLCWVVYSYMRSPEVDTHDEHEDVDSASG